MAQGVYKMRTICERTGFSPAVLRAWERRHELLDPDRTDGGHRLYTEDDLKVLLRVRSLLEEGRAIGEIASMGRGLLLQPDPDAPKPTPQPLTPPLPPEVDLRLDGWCRALVQAAVALDEAELEAILDEAFALCSPSAVIRRLIEPALITIGELWARGVCSVAGEHLASHKIAGRLLRLLESVNPASNNGATPALFACLPDEHHQLGALVAAYTVARHHYRVVYLGAALPFEDLERACRVLAPTLVCLSATREALVHTHGPALAELVGRHPRIRFLLGGSGARAECPELAASPIVLAPTQDDLLRALAEVSSRQRSEG